MSAKTVRRNALRARADAMPSEREIADASARIDRAIRSLAERGVIVTRDPIYAPVLRREIARQFDAVFTAYGVAL